MEYDEFFEFDADEHPGTYDHGGTEDYEGYEPSTDEAEFGHNANAEMFFEGSGLDYVLRTCTLPVLQNFLGIIYPAVFTCLAFRYLLWKYGRRGNEDNMHFCSALTGFGTLSWLLEHPIAIPTMLFGPVSYVCIIACSKRRNFRTYSFTVIVLLTLMILREHVPVLLLRENWDRVRSIHMIFIMKNLSVAYGLIHHEDGHQTSFLAYMGYLYHPGTIFLGPWIPYRTYLTIIKNTQQRLSWLEYLFELSGHILLATVFLAMSTCGIYWIFAAHGDNCKAATQSSMSVRSSHYFVSYTSRTLLFLSGGWRLPLLPYVTNPWRIEFPRSLVEVVIHWNFPMHFWLKAYIFRPIAQFGAGPGVAAIATFIISAMLHGLNVSVSAVLLSLAFYAFIEHWTRSKLSSLTSSCIRVRACRDCKHRHKSGLLVSFTNFIFTGLCLFHLNYLGVVLDSASQWSPEDFQLNAYELVYKYTLPWWNLGGMSHKVAIASYLPWLGVQFISILKYIF